MKKMNSISFQGLEKPENFGKLLAKGRRRRSSKRLRNQCGKLAYVKNVQHMEMQIKVLLL